MDMRKVVTVLSAIGASLALASSASALGSFSIQGSNLPGTNTYSIVMTYPGGATVQGYATGVTTTGTYTGIGSRSNPAPFTTALGSLTVVNGQTGRVSTWAATSGGVDGPGGTFTIGTIQITVVAGNTVAPDIGLGDGFYTAGNSTTVEPDSVSGITIVPEPTTAALLGLGILGLVVSGRRSRA
jgi:hypothetical protein